MKFDLLLALLLGTRTRLYNGVGWARSFTVGEQTGMAL